MICHEIVSFELGQNKRGQCGGSHTIIFKHCFKIFECRTEPSLQTHVNKHGGPQHINFQLNDQREIDQTINYKNYKTGSIAEELNRVPLEDGKKLTWVTIYFLYISLRPLLFW